MNMFDLTSLTESEKGELERYICIKKNDLSEIRKAKNQFIVEKYEDEYDKIPKEYRELFLVCIGEHFENSGHKIQDLHTPYHYNEYHPLYFRDILNGNEILKFKNIQSYYSCFTPTMTHNEIQEINLSIIQTKSSNDILKILSEGLDEKTERYLVGMYDILLESLQNGYEITGYEAMNNLKEKYKSEIIIDESTLLKPFMKSKVRK